MNEGEGTVCKEDRRRLCRGCVGRALCRFVRDQISTGAFEQAMRACACALMEAAYCSLVHARLRSVQLLLPHRRCV